MESGGGCNNGNDVTTADTCFVPGERSSVYRQRYKLLLGTTTRIIVPYLLELTDSNINVNSRTYFLTILRQSFHFMKMKALISDDVESSMILYTIISFLCVCIVRHDARISLTKQLYPMLSFKS